MKIEIGGRIIILVLGIIALLLFFGYRVGVVRLGDVEVVFTPPPTRTLSNTPTPNVGSGAVIERAQPPVSTPFIAEMGANSTTLVAERIWTDTNANNRLDFEDNRILVLLNVESGESIDLTDGRVNVRDASWSPDGSSIVFASDVGGNFDIYMMSANGGTWQPIVVHPAKDRGPTWSRDGKWIAFYSDRDGDTEIYRMSVTGGELKQLTFNTVDDEYPSWSSDSQWLAYQSGLCPDTDCQIHVMDWDGQNQRRLVSRNSYWPSWSPDNRHVGYSGVTEGKQANLFQLDLMNGSETRLTDSNSTGLSWSPDGRKIAFVSWRSDGPQVWTMNSDGSNPVCLTSGTWNTRPVWAP